MECNCCKSSCNGTEKGVTIELGTCVEYSENSVVSKTLLQAGGGNITVFAFDKGQGLSEHSAPFDAVVQIIEGEAEIIIGGEANSVSAGEVIIMPADIPHSVNSVSRFKMQLTMISK